MKNMNKEDAVLIKCSVEKDDVIVIFHPQNLSYASYNNLHKLVQDAFPGNKVLLLTEGIELKIMSNIMLKELLK